MQGSDVEYYDHLLDRGEIWPLQDDGSPLPIADVLARTTVTCQFVEPLSFFGQQGLMRWIPTLR
jgi:hypothetical protein